MTATRAASDRILLALQWVLAVVLFETGLAQAGLPLDELQARFAIAPGVTEQALELAGLAQALAAVLLVVPTATHFASALAPLTAAAVAIAFGAASAGVAVPVGLGSPALAVAVTLAAAAAAVGRGVLLPISALELGPEPTDPWLRPAG